MQGSVHRTVTLSCMPFFPHIKQQEEKYIFFIYFNEKFNEYQTVFTESNRLAVKKNNK